MSRAANIWFSIALAVWGVGVQLSDGLASAGWAASLAGVLVFAWPKQPLASIRRWWPVFAFVAWALIASALSHWPSWTQLARLADFVAIPVATVAVGAVRVPSAPPSSEPAVSAAERLGTSGTAPGSRRLEVRDLRPVWSTRRRILLPIAIVFAFSCVAATLQHFGLWPGEDFFHALGWTHVPFYRVYERAPGEAHRFMAGGLLFHRLKLAHVGGLAVIWWLVLGLRSHGKTRIAALTLAALGFFVIVGFTYARAADAALALALIAALLWSLGARRETLALGSGVVVLAIVVVLLTPSLRSRFLSSSTSEGSGDRRAFLDAAGRAIAQHPITGVGWGHFRPSLFAAPDTPPNVLAHPGKSHNQFVSIAAETGLPGGMLFVVLLGWLFRCMRGGSVNAIAGRASVVFLVLLSLLHDPIFHSEVSLAVMLALGAGCAAREDLPDA